MKNTLGEKIRVLALEDSPTQLASLKHLLKESGFAVITATNGKEGLAAAKAQAIDLVISDIVMPEMDGYEFCKALRADETLKNLPVILLTSLTEPRDLILGLQAGADHFICKPYDEQELLAHVRSVLANKAIRTTASCEMGITIFFAGQQFFINADRLQILDLLLSTYENAVSCNKELIRSREKLRTLNEQLEARVAERTKSLSSEIEAHNEALAALRKSEEIFRISFDNANVGKALTTLDGRLVRINAAFCALLGYERANIEGITFSEFIHPDDRTKNWETLRDLLSGELASARFERRYLHKDGHTVWADESVMLLRDTVSGEATQFITHIVDITERKRAEERLNIRNRITTVFNTASDEVMFSEVLSIILDVMNSPFGVFGYIDENGDCVMPTLTRNIWDKCQVPEKQIRFSRETWGDSAWPRAIKERRAIHSNKASTNIPMGHLDIKRHITMPILHKGEAIGLFQVANKETDYTEVDIRTLSDISEIVAPLLKARLLREWAAAALAQSEKRFRVLFENAADIILLLEIESDGAPVIRDANSATFRILGYEKDEIIGQPVTIIDAAPNQGQIKERRQSASIGAAFETKHLCKDGSIRDFECSGVEMMIDSKIFALSVERDITERKRTEAQQKNLEEQLRMSQKMEAIGSLAGGIAHDFNNLLSVILSYTGFLMKEAPEGDPSRSDLLEVKQAAERAANLTHQLLAFSRKQVLQPIQLDLNQVIRDFAKMLGRILGEDIELSYTLEPDLNPTMADLGQIEQVLMNLVVNARDAMPGGGKLTIETSNKEVEAEYIGNHPNMVPGAYVMLAVSDSGCGMDSETQARIFEPFYSTKGPGKGTGLGLSTVYGIVKQSGGFIWVYSEPGHGSTFKIYLPKLLDPLTVAVDKPLSQNIKPIGTATILLVEDEEAMRKATKRILVGKGYTVLAAMDGVDGLEVSARYPGEIHLLLTDIVMPNRGGKALTQELLMSRPSLKVIYMSGYTNDTIINHGVLELGTNFIGKPFTEDDLIRKIQEVLTGSAFDIAEIGETAHEPQRMQEKDSEIQDRDSYKGKLRALPNTLLDKLGKALIAARLDEIVEITQTIRSIDSELANVLERMTENFDYDGLRDFLRP